MAALDFAGMLRAGLRGLGLHPAQFWDLTPAELALMLGIEGGQGAMTRARLEAMAARFPDRNRGEDGRDEAGRGGVAVPAPAPQAPETDEQHKGGGDEQGRA